MIDILCYRLQDTYEYASILTGVRSTRTIIKQTNRLKKQRNETNDHAVIVVLHLLHGQQSKGNTVAMPVGTGDHYHNMTAVII